MTAASTSLLRIRELEAINAQITRHRDSLAVALRELTKPKYGVATMVVAHKVLGLDFEIPTVEESDDDLNLRY